MAVEITRSTIFIPLLLTVLAGLSTALGSLLALFIKTFHQKYLQFSLGLSAGVMIYVSFVELLASAIEKIGFFRANGIFFLGMFFMMIIDFAIPHEYLDEHVKREPESNRKLMKAGIYIALGIAIHNLPEGLAVFVSALGDTSLGVSLAFAIAIHNIPEGIAISLPVYYATGSRKKAFWYSVMSGIAEPVGALIGLLLLMPFLTQSVLSFCLSFVAGIMVFISFDELLPLAFKDEDGHTAMAGLILGMAIMALSLYLM